MTEKLKPCPFCGAPVMFYAGDRRGRTINDALWNKRANVERVGE